MTYKIINRKKPVLIGHKLKRIGTPYIELAYWTGSQWTYKEFNTRAQTKEFIKLKGIKEQI